MVFQPLSNSQGYAIRANAHLPEGSGPHFSSPFYRRISGPISIPKSNNALIPLKDVAFPSQSKIAKIANQAWGLPSIASQNLPPHLQVLQKKCEPILEITESLKNDEIDTGIRKPGQPSIYDLGWTDLEDLSSSPIR